MIAYDAFWRQIDALPYLPWDDADEYRGKGKWIYARHASDLVNGNSRRAGWGGKQKKQPQELEVIFKCSAGNPVRCTNWDIRQGLTLLANMT